MYGASESRVCCAETTSEKEMFRKQSSESQVLKTGSE